MKGIIKKSNKEEAIADFLINNGYDPFNVTPLLCILSGSRAQGLHLETSDRDYLGVHLADTWDCLEHPDFRPKNQVIRQCFNREFESVTGKRNSDISLDSFEMWKFISLYLKGSDVAYQLLYQPTIHLDRNADILFSLMREGITNKIGRAAKGIALHNWGKDKNNRKKLVLAYYRLLQAILFLREGEFEWQMDSLLDYPPDELVKTGRELVESYMDKDQRHSKLKEYELKQGSVEISSLIEETDRSMILTRLPERVPNKILKEVLKKLKTIRGSIV